MQWLYHIGMYGGLLNWRRVVNANRLAAAVLLTGLGLSGWKVFNRPAAPSGFAAVTPTAALSTHPVEPFALRLPNANRYQFDTQFVSSSPGQAVHAASLVELADGNLRAVWFEGSREGAGDVAVKTAVLNSQTLQWGQETTLLDRYQAQQGLWRYVKKLGNPVIARLSDGSLALWTVSVSFGGWAGSSIIWMRSTNDGYVWSKPKKLVTSPFLNISTLVKGAPFFYEGGQIGLPVYHEFISKFAEILRLSPDGGVLDKIRLPASHATLQPVVLVSSHAKAQAYLRSGTSAGVMLSTTSNAGLAWSPPAALRWPNPDSALAGTVTDTGRQYLALNNQSRGRQSLSLLQTDLGGSFDHAIPWVVEPPLAAGAGMPITRFTRQLQSELQAKGVSPAEAEQYTDSAVRQLCSKQGCAAEFSYPYLLESRDGYLHLVYTWHRTRIKYVRLKPLYSRPSAAPLSNSHAGSTTE